LDAETGGQKLALETADVHRDRKSGDETGEIPAETASLRSTTVSAVREDWMVGLIGIEPVTHQLESRGRTKKLGWSESNWTPIKQRCC